MLFPQAEENFEMEKNSVLLNKTWEFFLIVGAKIATMLSGKAVSRTKSLKVSNDTKGGQRCSENVQRK